MVSAVGTGPIVQKRWRTLFVQEPHPGATSSSVLTVSRFAEIYKGNEWGFGSGHGSLPRVTRGYREFVERFLRINRIERVVDMGCGDWQFSRLIDWGNANYVGADVVDSVVERNSKRFRREGVSFQVVRDDGSDLPDGDLLLCKDVLQHLARPSIERFVADVLPRYRYALLTNCVEPTGSLNVDIESGAFRPLDLRLPPFEVPATAVYEFTGRPIYSRRMRTRLPAWRKLVLLVDNQAR